MGLLDEILATKRREAEALARERHRRPADWEIRPVLPALKRQRDDALRLIAEIKLRSPSAGPLSRKLSAEERALVYEASGASMISVLTDARYFDGSFEHLARVREAGARLEAGLRAIAAEVGGEVRARGLLQAIDLPGVAARDFAARAIEAGLIVNPIPPSTIRLMPRLDSTDAEIDEALRILREVLAEVRRV